MLLEAHRAREGGVDPALESEDLAPDEVVVVGPGERVRVRVWVGLRVGVGVRVGVVVGPGVGHDAVQHKPHPNPSPNPTGLASGTMPWSMKTALRARCGCSRRKAW